jgi:hypothetical protein
MNLPQSLQARLHAGFSLCDARSRSDALCGPGRRAMQERRTLRYNRYAAIVFFALHGRHSNKLQASRVND